MNPLWGWTRRRRVTVKNIMRQLCSEGRAVSFSTHVLQLAQKVQALFARIWPPVLWYAAALAHLVQALLAAVLIAASVLPFRAGSNRQPWQL